MYEHHPIFEEPPETAVLWRYMTLGMFVSVLSRQALYFRRVDELEDQIEGQLPKPTYDITDPSLQAGYYDMRVSTIVNCWTMSPLESIALWKTYVSHGEGVAIRSTFNHLRTSFRAAGVFKEARVHIGRVRWVDFNEHNFIGPERIAFNAFVPLVHKRPYFEYESEVRAVISGLGTHFLHALIRGKPGLNVPVDLGVLIDGVYVLPGARQWFLEAVRSLVERYGLDTDLVRQSSVDAPLPTLP